MISLILPSYREKENIVLLVEAIAEELKGRHYEVLVVDDNSRDGTLESLALLGYSYLRVYCRHQKRSLAASIRYGLQQARGEVFVVMDSDFNHQPKYLSFMIDALEDYDGIFASRFLAGGAMDNRARFYLSALFNAFVRSILCLKVSDTLYGFFAIKKEALEACCYDDIFFGHGDYCMRLLYFLKSNNANIAEFPAVNGKRKSGRSKMRLLRMLWCYSRALIRFKAARLREKCGSAKYCVNAADNVQKKAFLSL